jgi:NADPH2:quinone reductase
MGVFWGSFASRDPQRNQAHLRELMAWYLEGRVKPHVSATYPMDRAADALNDLLARKVTGKAVLLVDERI